MKRTAVRALRAVALPVPPGLLLAAGCGGSGSQEQVGGGGAGAKTVDQEAVGVAIYPGAAPEEAYPGVYRMVTPDGCDEVVKFYRDALPGAAFSEMTIPTGTGASFMVTEDSGYRNVSIEENLPGPGRVTITVSKVVSR